MFTRLMNLDCELMVLGTKLFIAKETVASNFRYGAAVVSDKAEEMKVNSKKKINEFKEETKKKSKELVNKTTEKTEQAKPVKSAKETTKPSNSTEVVKCEIVEVVEVVEPDKANKSVKTPEVVDAVDAKIVEETPLTPGVVYAPDFSGLDDVVIPLEPEVNETVKEDLITQPVQDKYQELKEVTPEDIDKAIHKHKMLNNKPKTK